MEYALRIREKQKKVLLVLSALVVHDFGQFKRVSSFGGGKLRALIPAWKLYYGVRNWGWTVFWTPYAKPRLKSIMRYITSNVRESLGDLVYEQDRWVRIALRFLGAWHALTGRLGKVYPRG